MTIDPERARARLLALRGEIEADSRQTEDSRATVALDQQAIGRLSRMDSMQQQAIAKEQERRRQNRLMRIDRALRRIDEGEYGYCAECGEEIAEKRLEIDPMAERCVRCASQGRSPA